MAVIPDFKSVTLNAFVHPSAQKIGHATRNFAFYDVKRHDFKVEPGIFNVMVGASSDDIRLRGNVEVRGPESKTKEQSGKTGRQ